MARIRTIKPEWFQSEDLAKVSLHAERTFLGLISHADDSGRHKDLASLITGYIWMVRGDHDIAGVEQDLDDLAAVGLICRYTGCDGKENLHLVTWDKHQRIDKRSISRLSRCPQHQGHHKCGGCDSDRCPQAEWRNPEPTPRGLVEDSGRTPGGLDPRVSVESEAALYPRDIVGDALLVTEAEPSTPPAQPALVSSKATGQTLLGEPSSNTPGGLQEGAASGSRILDPGSSLTGREAPASVAPPGAVSAKDLVAEYVTECGQRPPQKVLGHLGREIKALLEEGFEPQAVRTALGQLRAKGLNPSTLASLVNAVVNSSSSAAGAGPWASASPTSAPYFNSTAPAPTTFGVSL
ncbi:hypothetical protein OG304_06515 [Streptomyces sp. NBC_00160]|uniref:hypothetical protein n=1 Tax=Streptomyces sp. NBC_00160 TaxID=2903628 RepID=UPI0022557B5B|nr:hypothetical protein [Streptomyces sp. NBC_00160]MCX5303105.1 hypothetical protein [Streptomyces sp. NBC_00160]